VPGIGIVRRGNESKFLVLSKYLSHDFDVKLVCRGKPDAPHIKVPAIDFSGKIWNRKIKNDTIARIFRRVHLTRSDCEILSFCFLSFFRMIFDKPDLLINSCGFWGGVLCRIMRSFFSIPFASDGGRALQGEYEDSLLMPDLQITVNPLIANKLKKRIPSASVIHIPNGIDFQIFNENKISSNIKMQSPRILSVGALNPQKRMDLVVRAVAKTTFGSLIIIGSGPDYHKIRSLGQQLLGNSRFKILDIPFDQMPSFYRCCDVFTMASTNEAFGIVYLEAMACGKPVVTQKDELREYIVGDAGYLLDCSDIELYAGRLMDAAKKNWGKRPVRAAAKFDWKVIYRVYSSAICSMYGKSKQEMIVNVSY